MGELSRCGAASYWVGVPLQQVQALDMEIRGLLFRHYRARRSGSGSRRSQGSQHRFAVKVQSEVISGVEAQPEVTYAATVVGKIIPYGFCSSTNASELVLPVRRGCGIELPLSTSFL